MRIQDDSQALVSGFAIRTSMSRALPGTYIGRVERVGRRLHEPVISSIGHLMMQSARSIPRLQRLDIRIFDEDRERRRAISESVCNAGGTVAEHRCLYARTIVMDLRRHLDATWPSVSKAARYKLRKFSRLDNASVRPITDTRYASRMQSLYKSTFDRTGTAAPAVDMEQVIVHSASGMNSRLVGVFLNDRPPPDDLVAFMRAKFHGDHASYEEGATDRTEGVRNLPLGYPLMRDLLDWTVDMGGTWFDFGGVPSEGSPASATLAGITNFKRQFSDKEIEVAEECSIEPRRSLAVVAHATRSVARLLQR